MLRGVEHDIRAVSLLLTTRGFHVAQPNGPQLTADRVSNALVGLIDATGPGELAVIYLTGHGYRTPDLNRDEVDNWDEAFVCADRPIVDDWFREQLWPRARSGAKIVAVVDACHSDTTLIGLRAMPRVPPPVTQVAPNGYYRLILSACRDKETTMDLGPSDYGGGVVTKTMLKALRDGRPTYRRLWADVASNVAPDYFLGIGTPQMNSLGPNDDLLDAVAFEGPGENGGPSPR